MVPVGIHSPVHHYNESESPDLLRCSPMPVVNHIDRDAKRIIVVLTDPFDIQQVTDASALLFVDSQFICGYDLVADMHISWVNISAEGIRYQAEKANTVKKFFSGRQALVCHQNKLLYGLSRMYAAFSESFGITAQVFTTMMDAEQWLDDCRRDEQGHEITFQ